MPSDMPPEIRGYKILEMLGSGTSGTVFEAIRKADGKKLALKVLRGATINSTVHSLLSRVNHPHILTPEGIVTSASDELCLLFRLIKTTNPRQDIPQQGPRAALRLLVQALSAVSYLHDHGLVHADIKPSNVLCELGASRDALGLNLVLADFDFSLESGGSSSEGVTGTLGYLAPELLSSSASTFQTDIFALGAWFYWVVTGLEPFGADNPREALAHLEQKEKLKPIGRIDHRFANSFWDEIIDGMTARDPSRRFENGNVALQFLVEKAPSVVEGAESDIPRLLWNPSALLQEEAQSVSIIQSILSQDRVKSPLVVLQGGRPSALREMAGQLSRLVSNEGPSVIRPEGFSYAYFDRVLSDRPEVLVIDNVDNQEQFDSEQIVSFLRLIGLGWSRKATGSGAVIVLEAPGRSGMRSKEDGLGALFDIIDINPIPYSDFSPDALALFFSGVEVDRELVASFERVGASDVDSFVSAVEVGFRYGALSLSGGRISLHARSGTEFLASPDAFAHLAVNDAYENSVHNLVSKLPSGLSRKTVELLRSAVNGFEVSLNEAVNRNVIRWTQDERSLVCVKSPRLGAVVSTSVRDQVRVICDAMRTRHSEVTDCQEEELVASVYGTRADRKAIRRFIAYSRALLRRGMVSEAFGMTRDLPDLDLSDPLVRARWHETRAYVLNGLDEFEKSQSEYEEAARCFENCGRYVLAGRALLRLSIEARGWSRPELADSLRQKAEVLLSRTSSGSRDRLVAVIRAEEANNLINAGDVAMARAKSEALISEGTLDSRAKAVCHRVLALSCLRSGELEAARSHYAQGIRSGRRSKDTRVLSRVLVSAAIFESSRGYYLRGERINKRILRYPTGSVRNSERYSAWTGLGGMAYESGWMQQALEINVRALALCEHTRDEMRIGHAETNVALILGEMGRIGESLAVAQSAAAHRNARTGERALAWNLIGRAYTEIGTFDLAEEFLMKCLDEEQGAKTPVARATVYKDFASLEKCRSRLPRALTLLTQSKMLADEFKARDESLDAEFLLAADDPMHRIQGILPNILADLLERSKEVGNQRIQDQIRAAIAEHDSSIPIATRLADIDSLLSTAIAGGYGSFVMTLLRIKAELLIEKKDYERAQDVLRETLNRIKAVADGLSDPGLRKTYLADPRRQRVLELIRKTRNP